ncbi:MAG: hypothetical protein KJ578_02850 [Bacteroidetes bacterium]|nr:hypothetical protein [Bacteroidota bacterium]MBU1580076.1 hypothetical protein [Bacteroidota bacterium]MBU2466185.1 hypothetical protein [Bacteroidota bacterium]MBU2556700.1 hypothetical protein [Bacteroidota bacterium]
MEKKTTSAELKEAIQLREEIKIVHLREMRTNFSIIYERLKPANIIKSTLNGIGSSPNLSKNILNTGLALLAGILSKKALSIGDSNSKSRKLLGLILQLGITNMVIYGPDAIKSFFLNVFSKRKKLD